MKTRIVSNTDHKKSVAILNELFAKLDCSLARYLSYARPWTRRRYLLLDAVARRMSYDHEVFAGNIARLIYERRGAVRSRVFPMEFTSTNDLSLEFLAPRLLEHERALIAMVRNSAKQLDTDPEARRVVNRIAASLQRYAELLQELLAPHRIAPPSADDNGVESEHRRLTAPLGSEPYQQYAAAAQSAA